MAHVIPFEIFGLHYVLSCSDDPSAPGLQFRLRDESFSSPVKTFSAWSFEDLFSKVEEHIGLPLAFDLRSFLREQVETAEASSNWVGDMAVALGRPVIAQCPTAINKIAIGMR